MKIVSDPRCPAHPSYQAAFVFLSGNYFVAVWRCSVCGRPLGAASASTTESMEAAYTFPLHRWARGRPKVRDMAARVVDYRVVRVADRGGRR